MKTHSRQLFRIGRTTVISIKFIILAYTPKILIFGQWMHDFMCSTVVFNLKSISHIVMLEKFHNWDFA
jgi:hypothetical protein